MPEKNDVKMMGLPTILCVYSFFKVGIHAFFKGTLFLTQPQCCLASDIALSVAYSVYLFLCLGLDLFSVIYAIYLFFHYHFHFRYK